MTDPGSNFLSAALRHARDAGTLLAGSRDQAWHLAGFAHECARKALLGLGWVPRVLGHDFAGSSEEILGVAASFDGRAARLPVQRWTERYPAVRTWHPEHRYDRTGTCDRTQRDVVALVDEARAAVDDCMVALLLEGALAADSIE